MDNKNLGPFSIVFAIAKDKEQGWLESTIEYARYSGLKISVKLIIFKSRLRTLWHLIHAIIIPNGAEARWNRLVADWPYFMKMELIYFIYHATNSHFVAKTARLFAAYYSKCAVWTHHAGNLRTFHKHFLFGSRYTNHQHRHIITINHHSYLVFIFVPNMKPQCLITCWSTECLSDVSVIENGNVHYAYAQYREHSQLNKNVLHICQRMVSAATYLFISYSRWNMSLLINIVWKKRPHLYMIGTEHWIRFCWVALGTNIATGSEWISNFIQLFTGHVITYPWWD